MRQGQNPQKNKVSFTTPPAEITVTVLNYIPEKMGYFEHVLDSLKLCLASIREYAAHPFDLLVLDNGSCEEVRSYLREELAQGRIDYLIMNKRNVGKLNAVFQMLSAAPGDFIFYSDGDIYYKPGWMQAHLDILKAYPNVGLVGGLPLRNQANIFTEHTLGWVEERADRLTCQKGDLIPEEWTREFLRSVDQEEFIENWIHLQDCKVTYDGITAYVGASHMQYLISRRVSERIPRFRSDNALSTKNDLYIDNFLESAGYLRLSTEVPYVYHIGNAIAESWLTEEFGRLVREQPEAKRASSTKPKHWFWGRWLVRRTLKAIYNLSFKLLYENS
jgi:glycosyltransferase involved in cell wall biosynthesis